MIKIYTDGSFRDPEPRAGWAFVVVRGNQILHKAAGLTAAPALSRNIDGECEGVAQALEYCKASGIDSVTLYHDYAGLALWPLGKWRATSEVALRYLERVRAAGIEVEWIKVKGHSGDHWNEFVDRMASRAVKGEL